MTSTRDLATHRVENQPDPGTVPGLWADDAMLRRCLAGAGGDARAAGTFAETLQTPEMRDAAEAARRDLPRLDLFGRDGARRDQVAYSPGYHAVHAAGRAAGYHAVAWEGAAGGHATHAAMVYLLSQVEPGICCPLTMAYAGVPALQGAGRDDWAAKLMDRGYDPRAVPEAEKPALTLGMAMTEKQGGSDVRANSTRAEPADGAWRLTGHKWFCSAPMSDGFLTLAQTKAGLSCFLVPRWLEDGPNGIRLQRLKDKMGNVANASSEIEYDGARAEMLGEDGEGVRTIIEMVHHTRLDTAMAPAALMRAAVAQATWWVEGRQAFGATLIDQPLMQQVLADLVLDAAAATALGFRIARAFDGAGEADRAFARIGVAIAKFINNKRCIAVVAEAMEVLGGMGYVNDTPMPMLYREAPLNSIWEGSGNVICLDILRTLAREPRAAEALDAVLDAARGQHAGFDAALERHRATSGNGPDPAGARGFALDLGELLSAAALLDAAPGPLADGYLARLGQRRDVAGAGGMAGADRILGAWLDKT
ncbi:acyl-CoA dehydrogenase family protein [Pseudaestuariivita atlantica]|uniref:Acyl-CoA dehydrogenase n=1 Tax=Pseudaestuariivita atlantica TaxID=1317121 RepID=A0A0L1JM19_9RHOB|nr:acyl-CoA dehydrogenase family protein [Pseudaestuariivita atlantica]KNG92777.1 acyl-CoA dehydrogenase [Pseudaestuariivita atlantica]